MVPEQQRLDKFRERVFSHIQLTPTAFHPLRKFVHEKTFPRKTFLLHVGQRWDRLFYIQRGLIRLFYTDIEGREFNKAFFWEGHCIWPVAPRDRTENSLFSIAALEDVTVLSCPFQRLYEFLRQYGCWEQFALPFAETLVEQKFQREHDLLLLSASERYDAFVQSNPDVARRIPDYHMASFLGVTSVTLSRVKNT